MVSHLHRCLLGSFGVVLGLSLVVASQGVPVTVCVGPTDSLTCTTDTTAQATGVLCLVAGIGGIVAGGRELWTNIRALHNAL